MLFKKGHVPANKGKKLSEEHCKKLSDSHKGQKAWNKGIPCREETKKKISKKNTGKVKTIETRQKLSNSLKGRTSPMKGKHHTIETKQKMSKSMIGIKKPPFTEEHKKKLSISHKGKAVGDLHPSKRPEIIAKMSSKNSRLWKGGYYMSVKRQNNRRRNMGFIPISTIIKEGDYEWHHIIKGEPYVVQCPTHIHKMFKGGSGNNELHYHNIKAFLGIINVEDPEIPMFKHIFLEGDVQ